MRSLLTAILICIEITICFSQITTTKIADKPKLTPDTTKYDSTRNIMRNNVYQYIGQELYILGKPEVIRGSGYKGFFKNYKKSTIVNKSNVYGCCSGYNSKYEALVGKYFEVLNVYRHPKSDGNSELYDNTYYLELKERESGDIVYFEFDTKYITSTFYPFLIVGYFEKLKSKYIGIQYVVRGLNWVSFYGSMKDMNTAKPVSMFDAGNVWTCVDVTVEEKNYELILVLENEAGEHIPLKVSDANNLSYVIEKTVADNYLKTLGAEKWQSILEGKVEIGMTQEMCRIAWGKPNKINETITSGGSDEQWVYSKNYLYFENGILTAIQ